MYGCEVKSDQPKPSNHFNSFEISYTDGWRKHFSFFLDSNKIYFSPGETNMTYYGILPDTIFKTIDSVVFKIRYDTTIKSKNNDCADCSVAAIKIIAKSDTIRISQAGDIDKIILTCIKFLEDLIDSNRAQNFKGLVVLQTRAIVRPPLPPEIDNINFIAPKRKSKK